MQNIQMIYILIVSLVIVSPACAQNTSRADKAPTTPATTCTPLETRPANAPDQKPAFAGQARACAARSDVAFELTVLAKGLDKPWAVEPLPDGGFLITEKAGRMRIIGPKGEVGEPILGLVRGQGGVNGQGGSLAITDRNQGGLLDVALSPSFETDRTIFWSFSEQRDGGSGRALPTYDNGMHFGSRLAFATDGKLFITLGDRFDIKVTRPQAQHLNSHLGKIIRINPDGSVPTDNPFVSQQGALPEIWSLGHRNIQSATIDDKGRLWTIEHGAKGGDELNLIEKGKNYGWPVISYGEEYSGEPIPGNITAKPGLEQPVYYWDPVIAPSGAQFYTGNAFPAWRGSIFIGGLASQRLVRLAIQGDRVVGEEHLLTERNQRIRDVRQGPDGALYVVTDSENGELWRIAPRRN
jgi:aldose sugar dehydrogenase